MIWHRNAERATPADFARMDLIRKLGCMCCALKGDVSQKPVELHHIKSGNKRLGHLYTIPLCAAHHRGKRGAKDASEPAVHDGMKAFVARWGYTDLQLWQKLQVMLGQDDSPPPSKIFKRRGPNPEAERTP